MGNSLSGPPGKGVTESPSGASSATETNNSSPRNVKIRATDLSEEMVRRTQEGVDSQFEVNRGLPAPMLLRHFERLGPQWRARPELRKMLDGSLLAGSL